MTTGRTARSSRRPNASPCPASAGELDQAADARPRRARPAAARARASSKRNDGWKRGRPPTSASAVARSVRPGCPSLPSGSRAQQRLEISVDDERLDLPVVARSGRGSRPPLDGRPGPRSPARAARTQPAMDQDAYGALRPPEDVGDLAGRHLVDEAQHDRPPPVAGQAVDGAPGRSDGLALDDGPPRRRAGRRSRPGRPRAAPPVGAEPAATFGDNVAGDAEQPDAERGGALAVVRRGPLLGTAATRRGRTGTSVRWRPPPRDGRRARRSRSCTPGPRTSDTARRTARGPLARPPRATDRDRGGRARERSASTGRAIFLNAGRAMALHPDLRRLGASRTWRISPTTTARRPSGAPRSSTSSAPVDRIDADGPYRRSRAVRRRRARCRARS